MDCSVLGKIWPNPSTASRTGQSGSFIGSDGIAHVIDRRAAVRKDGDAEHVDPVRNAPEASPCEPGERAGAEPGALLRGDRLRGRTVLPAPARLHFHENDLVSATEHEVDLAVSASPPAID